MASDRERFPGRIFAVRPLACVCACFCLGCALAMALPLSLPLLPLAAGAVLFLALSLLFRRGAVLCGAALCLGALMVSRALIVPPLPEVKGAELSGRIASEARQMNGYLRFKLRDVTVNGEKLPCGVMFSVYGDADPADYPYGAAFHATAKTYRAHESHNSYAFSYRDYLWRQGIGLVAYANENRVRVEDGGADSFMARILSLRRRLGEGISALYPQPLSGIVHALVLGVRNEMDEEADSLFRQSGISHLLALSGLHIAIVALFLSRLLGLFRIPRKVTLPLTLILLALYAVLVGSRASVLRAALFFGLLEAAHLARRPYDGLTALFAALTVLLLVNPLSIGDSGLILSFSAVGGILCLTDPLTPRAIAAPPPGYGRPVLGPLSRLVTRRAPQLVILSLSAQLGALPASAGMFHTLYLLSLPANLVAVPLVSLTLPFAFASAFLSPLWMTAARVLSLPVRWALCLVLGFARALSRLPLSTLRMPSWPALLTFAYLVFGLLASPYLLRGRKARLAALCALPLVCAAVMLAPLFRFRTGMTAQFLDVGDADCAVLFSGGGTTLIDAGQYDDGADYLDAVGKPPDRVFLTHPHTDHALGFSAILDIFPPAELYLPEAFFSAKDPGEGIYALVDRAKALGWRVTPLRPGDIVPLSGGAEARVLQPSPDAEGDANALSLVLEVAYAGRSLLFTGDLPISAEADDYPDCDVLKVAHHGSKSSTSERFLALAKPEIAVISGDGDGNHPAPEVLDRLAGMRVYRTDRQGMITLRISPAGEITATTFLEEEAS